MRQQITPFLILAVLFLTNCSSNKNTDFPLDFDKKYYCQLGEGSKHFNPDYANTILFYEDGTYVRTEACGLFGTVFFHEHNYGGVFIDHLKGSWMYYDGNLSLSDEEIKSFYCTTNLGVKISDCNMDKEHIPLGLSEWFRSSKVLQLTDESIFVERQKSIH